MSPSELLSIANLSRRWIFTREGIGRLVNRDVFFPAPSASISGGTRGRTRLWTPASTGAYERGRPHRTDADEKRRPQKQPFADIARLGGEGGR